MTFMEKYMSDHPDDPRGLMRKCPEDYNYEPDDYACDEMPNCEACWQRRMPEGDTE